MEQSRNAQEMIELMNAVNDVDLSEEGAMFVANAAKGPGTHTIKTPNDYRPSDVQKIAQYILKYVKSGTAPKSWKGDYQSFINTVGKGMEEFKVVKLGNPGYKEGEMKGDMLSGSYKPNSYDKGSSGSRPGSIRGTSIKGMSENKKS